MNLKDKKVLISGGSSGLGKQLCLKFLEEGSRVYSFARTTQKFKQDKKLSSSSNFSNFACDVSNYESLHSLYSQIGPVDILINNAGVFQNGQLQQTDVEDIDLVFDVNLKGLVYSCKIALEVNKENPLIIFNIGSSYGTKSVKNCSVYASSKWGVRGFSDSLRNDLEGTNKLVYIIQPGGMQTDLFENANDKFDLSTCMKPEDVADLVLYQIQMSDKMDIDEIRVNRKNK